ncbi:MAG: hypothetical protein V1494_04210 [Candidatus Diapherotrites archaeon]
MIGRKAKVPVKKSQGGSPPIELRQMGSIILAMGKLNMKPRINFSDAEIAKIASRTKLAPKRVKYLLEELQKQKNQNL